MAYNEYSTRFFFRFESDAGREFRIDIKKRSYSGSAEQRPLGQTPVLRRESGDRGIFGTSMEIYAECKIDGEFAELYTSDAKEFLVELSEVSGGTATIIWRGFVVPELYSEPEVAPPYDVQITATDGLGYLKLYNFEPIGRQSLYTHLHNILSYSGLLSGQSNIWIVDSLECVTPSVSASSLLTGMTVDIDHLAESGTNCYDALSAILTSLGLTITRYADHWLLMRDSDVEVSGSEISARSASGTTVSLPTAQYGSMRSVRWYPVGRMETDIEPAKNSAATFYPYQMRDSMFTNPNLPDGTGWTYPVNQPNVDHYVEWIYVGGGEMRPMLFNSRSRGSTTIYQDINVDAYDGRLTLRILTMLFGELSAQTYFVFFRLRLTAAGATYYLKKKDLGEAYEWVTSDNEIEYKAERLSGYTRSTQIPVSSFNDNSFAIPGLPASGTLRIEITSKSKAFSLFYRDQDFYIGGVFLIQDAVPGYKDVVLINNGARGSANDTELSFGDSAYSPNALLNIHNILATSGGAPASYWKTSRFSGEYLSVIAMEAALSVSLPRLKARGVLNVPVNGSLPAAIANPDGIAMLIQTYSWKLVDDNLDVELISVPASEMTITSETIEELSQEEANSIGGSSSAASQSGGSSSGGGYRPEFFEAIEDEYGDVLGAKALYELYIKQVEADEEQGIEEVIKNISEILRHLFLVNNNGTLYLRSDISFYSDHAVSAGGISDTGGGGGGGIDADAMWRLLADSTNEQINASHLTNALDQYASKSWVEAQGYITEASLDLLPVTTALSAHGSRLDSLEGWLQRPYLEELNSDVINTRRLIFDGNPVEYIATDDDILDLNVAIAAHGSRLDSLEGWLQRPYLEELTLSALHVERSIDLGGTVLDYDYVNEAWHLRGNFYADGFVSAGGMSDTGSGSGGGINPSAMWAMLEANTSEQINASHLTGALAGYATQNWVEAHGYITEAAITSSAIIAALGYTPAGVDSLHPLAVSVAANSGRIASLENWLRRPYLAELVSNSLNIERSITLGGITLVYDYGASAWHLKGNFYADGFVSAGGYSGSESSGGINATAMWNLLAGATNEQINASHLSDALNGYATQAWVEAQGYSLTAEAIAIALNYVPVAPDDLHPLATSIAAHGSRLDSLEGWLQRPYLEEMSITSLHLERSIDLGGIVLDYDYVNEAWHLRGNFYTDGFVSAGGMSSTQTSSGGIDAAAMWALLADSTNEQINASHLPLSVTQGDGNYVQGFTYASGVFSVVRATMPTALPDPYALSFGSKSFNGSAAVSLTASDLGAITYVRNVGPTLSRGNTHTVAVVGDTNLTVTMPNFALASEIPTIPSSLPNPYSLTIGNKSYNGSSSVTISGTDLTGAIGSNYVTNASYASSAGSAASATYDDQANRIYTNYGASLSAASNALKLLSKSGATLTTITASDLVTVLGSTAVNRATGDKNGNDIYTNYGASLSAASNALKLLSNSGATLSTITAANIVTVLGNTAVNRATADANGNNIASTYLPVSGGTISGDLRLQSGSYGTHLYFGDAQYCYLHENTDDHLNIYGDKGIDLLTSGSNRSINLGSSSAAAAVNIFGAATLSSSLSVSGSTSLSSTLSVSGNATFALKIYLTSNAYLEYNSSNAGIHCSKGFYSDNYMSAGGYASSSDRRLKTEIIGISEKRAWDVIGSLKPVEFRWKIGGEKSAGFVAQDVEPYLPEAVIDIGGIKRLRYDVIFSYGIAAISSLKLHTESTEQKVRRLERRVSELEERLRIK